MTLKHYQREQIIWESKLPGNEKFLLLALNSFVDANGECWPGQELLARMCGLTDRTVRNLCKGLEEKGIIQRNRRFSSKGQRTSDKFCISFDSILPPENISGASGVKSSRSGLPENISTGNDFHRKMTTVLPENDDSPTGNIFQGSIQRTIQGKDTPLPPKGECANADACKEKRRGKSRTAKPDPYKVIQGRERFEAFWKWYKDKVCSIGNSNPGVKKEAASAWVELERSNFMGIGLDEFVKACGLYLRLAISTRGVGVRHGFRFLSGGASGSPQWLELYQEATQPNAASAEDFISESEAIQPPPPNPWLTRQDVISDEEAQRIMAIQPAWHRSDEDAEALALYGRVQWEREQAALQGQGVA